MSGDSSHPENLRQHPYMKQVHLSATSFPTYKSLWASPDTVSGFIKNISCKFFLKAQSD